MTTSSTCMLCSLAVEVKHAFDTDIYHVKCSVCGGYQLGNLDIDKTIPIGNDARRRLSGVVRTHYEMTGKEVLITTDNLKALESAAPDEHDIPAKVRHLLRYLAKKTRPGTYLELAVDVDYPVCFASNEAELRYYLEYILVMKYADGMQTRGGGNLRLTPLGWEESTKVPTLLSENVFVAMSFSREGPRVEQLRLAYKNGIQPAIEDETGYHAVKIDDEQFIGDIVFEIIARLKESRFVVADVTEHKNGVYFEAGYAMGMQLPVIWTCHKSDMDHTHFDTSHLNHIVWEEPTDLRKKLATRILATIGRGPRQRP